MKTINAYDAPTEPDDLLHRQLRIRMKEMISNDQWDDLSPRERIALLTAIARIETLFPKIMEAAYASPYSGATVRKYAQTFAANAASKREQVAGDDAVAAFLTNDDDSDELEH
jgi:hypothetical protein